MKRVQFVNFIGFGKRMSIDLRCVVFDAESGGVPQHFHISDEARNFSDEIIGFPRFNEMAKRLLVDLATQLSDAGLPSMRQKLFERIVDATNGLDHDRRADSFHREFASLIALIHMLNDEEFEVTDVTL